MEPSLRTAPTGGLALSQLAARAIREAILDGYLLPGTRLVERDLAATFQVSRVPVREALRQLVRDGLVRMIPRHGAVVTDVSPSLVVDVFAVRIALEGLASRIAATRIPEESLRQLAAIVAEMDEIGRQPTGRKLVEQDLAFHRALAAACDRPVLLDALDAVWNKTALLISASRPAYPLDRIGQLHRPILEAVVTRDPDRTEAAVRAHLVFGESMLLRHLMEADKAAAPGRPGAPAAVTTNRRTW